MRVPSRPCSRRTSVCERRSVQRDHGAALAANGNLVTGAPDCRDGTGRAEEGGRHLFLAVSIYDTPNKYQVVFLGHDVTPVRSLRKGELAGHCLGAHPWPRPTGLSLRRLRRRASRRLAQTPLS
jgi:hypothetical protein